MIEMVSQAEIYEYLSANKNKSFTTSELTQLFKDKEMGGKLRQLNKFKLVEGENLDKFRHSKWWVAE